MNCNCLTPTLFGHFSYCPSFKPPINIPIVPADAKLPPVVDEHGAYEGYAVKDSGQRQSFESGMVRDVQTNKIGWHRVADGPMLKRWAEHITKGGVKYPDVAPGKPNWTLASGEAELQRFRQSAFRHFMSWFNGETDEDHAAAVMFNLNGAEYVKEKLRG